MQNLEITMGPTFELLALPSSVARVIPIGPPVRSSSTWYQRFWYFRWRLEGKAHREWDKFPPLSLLASIAMTIGSPVVTIASGWQPSQLKKAATAPEIWEKHVQPSWDFFLIVFLGKGYLGRGTVFVQGRGDDLSRPRPRSPLIRSPWQMYVRLDIIGWGQWM